MNTSVIDSSIFHEQTERIGYPVLASCRNDRGGDDGLGPDIGRDTAHDLVDDLCPEALAQKRPLLDLLARTVGRDARPRAGGRPLIRVPARDR